MKISQRAHNITPFYVMEVGKAAADLGAKVADSDQPMVFLNIGEPDFTAPPLVQEAAARAIHKGLSQYTPALGLTALRERISHWYSQRYALDIAPERIVVGGFSQGACVAAWAVSRCAHKLGGCALWSGYVGDKAVELTAALRASRNVATRFTYGHGSVDPTVLPECGEVFVAALEQAGVGVDARVFEGVKHGCSL
jgi:dienelactone hydrolase